MSFSALSPSVTQSVYKYFLQRTLNLVTSPVFLILTAAEDKVESMTHTYIYRERCQYHHNTYTHTDTHTHTHRERERERKKKHGSFLPSHSFTHTLPRLQQHTKQQPLSLSHTHTHTHTLSLSFSSHVHRASFLLAVRRKSLISLICFGMPFLLLRSVELACSNRCVNLNALNCCWILNKSLSKSNNTRIRVPIPKVMALRRRRGGEGERGEQCVFVVVCERKERGGGRGGREGGRGREG